MAVPSKTWQLRGQGRPSMEVAPWPLGRSCSLLSADNPPCGVVLFFNISVAGPQQGACAMCTVSGGRRSFARPSCNSAVMHSTGYVPWSTLVRALFLGSGRVNKDQLSRLPLLQSALLAVWHCISQLKLVSQSVLAIHCNACQSSLPKCVVACATMGKQP